jgi:hypothetical protein
VCFEMSSRRDDEEYIDRELEAFQAKTRWGLSLLLKGVIIWYIWPFVWIAILGVVVIVCFGLAGVIETWNTGKPNTGGITPTTEINKYSPSRPLEDWKTPPQIPSSSQEETVVEPPKPTEPPVEEYHQIVIVPDAPATPPAYDSQEAIRQRVNSQISAGIEQERKTQERLNSPRVP